MAGGLHVGVALQAGASGRRKGRQAEAAQRTSVGQPSLWAFMPARRARIGRADGIGADAVDPKRQRLSAALPRWMHDSDVAVDSDSTDGRPTSGPSSGLSGKKQRTEKEAKTSGNSNARSALAVTAVAVAAAMGVFGEGFQRFK